MRLWIKKTSKTLKKYNKKKINEIGKKAALKYISKLKEGHNVVKKLLYKDLQNQP